MEDRPRFISSRPAAPPQTPEELFLQLERDRSHGYLRGPQQEVLRQYVSEALDQPDVALELPTGTGKTAVGLLIAEWRRQRHGTPAAFLCLTNQLAHQVMAEAERLGIDVADLTGGRGQRSAAAEGRYRTGQALAVTTYSNVFNVNPVISASDILVFDDIHGGEHYVVDMWTVRVSADEDEGLYHAMLEVLRPVLVHSQLQALEDVYAYSTVHLADIEMVRTVHPGLIALLDSSDLDNVKFAWRLIRNKLAACVVLVSRSNIVIRPIVPPTHTHEAFSESKQRIFMSATLGTEGDLQRAFGIRSVNVLRATHAQWGHRYFFIPEVYCLEDSAWNAVGKTWDELDPKRAVLLAPSSRILDGAFDKMNGAASASIERVSARDIGDSLDVFTKADNTVLAVAGRYDGLDLPDEDCRLLLMVESPGAIGELERHLREQWKLGPVLRRKERVRLIQGLGRCTRNATDFAVVFWLGQTLADAATNRSLVDGFPPELRAELAWGLEQSQMAAKSIDSLIEMAAGLLEDPQYRAEANKQITSLVPENNSPTTILDATSSLDVRFAAQVWDEDYEGAYKTAREIADQLNDVYLTGLRAWWWYLASCIARRVNDAPGEADCMNRAYACVVNSGWLRAVSRMRGQIPPHQPPDLASNVEKLWDNLSRLGFAGPRFNLQMNAMMSSLRETDHSKFHGGLELLGAALGATVVRTSDAGAPDVVWYFAVETATFEAKTEKDAGGELSKSDVQQANGHVNWAKKYVPGTGEGNISPIIVSPTSKLHEAAVAHVEGLNYLAPADIQRLARDVRVFLSDARAKFAQREFAEIQRDLATAVNQAGLGARAIMGRLCETPLSEEV